MFDRQPLGPIIWSADGTTHLLDEIVSEHSGIERIATIVVAKPEKSQHASWPNAESFYRLLKRERPIAFQQNHFYEQDNFVSLYQFYSSKFPLQ